MVEMNEILDGTNLTYIRSFAQTQNTQSFWKYTCALKIFFKVSYAFQVKSIGNSVNDLTYIL